jgi:hypothetical protein
LERTVDGIEDSTVSRTVRRTVASMGQCTIEDSTVDSVVRRTVDSVVRRTVTV